MVGFNLVKAASKFLVESIQKMNWKLLTTQKIFVKTFHPWLRFHVRTWYEGYVIYISYVKYHICLRESLKGHLAILKIHQYRHFATALMKGLGRDAWIGAWAKGIFLSHQFTGSWCYVHQPLQTYYMKHIICSMMDHTMSHVVHIVWTIWYVF